MKKIIILFLIMLFPLSLDVSAQDWNVDSGKSSITFEVITDNGVVSGSFKEFTSEITLDPDNPSAANIKAVMSAESLKANDSTAANIALGASWLFSKKFPEITYQSKTVTKLGEGKYEIDGVLSVKDVSKQLKLPFNLEVEGDKAEAKGKTKIDRAIFKLGDSGDAGPSIEVSIHISATKK